MAVADPTGLKPKLAKFANAKLAQLVNSSVLKDKLVIGKLVRGSMACTLTTGTVGSMVFIYMGEKGTELSPAAC